LIISTKGEISGGVATGGKILTPRALAERIAVTRKGENELHEEGCILGKLMRRDGGKLLAASCDKKA